MKLSIKDLENNVFKFLSTSYWTADGRPSFLHRMSVFTWLDLSCTCQLIHDTCGMWMTVRVFSNESRGKFIVLYCIVLYRFISVLYTFFLTGSPMNQTTTLDMSTPKTSPAAATSAPTTSRQTTSTTLSVSTTAASALLTNLGRTTTQKLRFTSNPESNPRIKLVN